MKVQRRTFPMDVLSVSKGKSKIIASTHRHTISIAAYDDLEQVAWHEFTFDQLYQLLKNLKPGIADICTPP